MSEQTPTVTAREFIAAILAALRAHFQGIDVQIGSGFLVDLATDEPASTLAAPWLLLQVLPQELDRSARRRPGRVPVAYVCNVQCCLSTKTADFTTELTEFASNVLTLVAAWERPIQSANQGEYQAGRRWGLGAAVDPPRAIACYPGALGSMPHGHDALIVSWEQTIYRPERLTAADPTG